MGKFSVLFESKQLDEARLVQTHTNGNRSAKVYGKNEDGEHVVKFFVDNKHQKNADYHTDDLDDAHGTAKHHVNQVKNESTENALIESKLQHFKERVEEYDGHRSDHTGITYHADKRNSEKIANLTHGQTDDLELVHHDGEKLHIKKYEATKLHKAVHLHDDEGNHVDSFKHPLYHDE